ncbi:MAG: FAD-dependent oxidoreductase [Pseudomonadota bacterium]
MKKDAKVVIVGGGIYGCSLLYHLTKRGWRDVVLVEKNELTAGSTWHAAGLCTNFAHHLTIMRMRNHSVRLYRDVLEKETGQPTGFTTSGALRMTRLPERMDEFRQVAQMGRWIDVDFQIISPPELKEIYPLVETEGLIGAIYEPQDGYTDPTQTTNALARGARSGGAEIYRHTAVTTIAAKPDGRWRVTTENGDINCDMVVNAAGTWAREIGEMVGLDLPIVPMLHQYMVTDRIGAYAELERTLPIIRDPEESWYVRPERDGAILGTYEKEAVPWSIDGVPPEFGMELLPGDLERMSGIAAQAMDRIPSLADAGIKEIVNGPITFTPDANALIGPAPGLPGFWIMAGTSMGVMEGGGAGKFLADWMVDGEPGVDMSILDPRRFGPFADWAYRVERAEEAFGNQFAIHFPGEELPAGRPRKKTPVYDRLADRGAFFGVRFGWERANFFGADGTQPEQGLSFRRTHVFEHVRREVAAVTDHAGVIDLSGFAKFQVCGKDAEAFLNALLANRVPGKSGRIALCHALSQRGGIVAEFTVTRMSDETFYLCSAAAQQIHDREWLLGHVSGGQDLHIMDITEETAILGLQGPRARDILAKVTDADLGNEAFPWLSQRDIQIAGRNVRALRVSYGGELGYEFHMPMDAQLAVYDALKEADPGLADFGFFALDTMRLEKGYLGFGADISIETTPWEAGLDAFIKLDRGDFMGRDALMAQGEKGLSTKLVCLRIESKDRDAMGNEAVLDDGGRTVGIVSSGGYGHRVQASLALAYVEPGCAAHGTALAVLLLGQPHPAKVIPAPAFDPDGARMRG